ncbi:MAG: MobA/MobL family protein [Oscillospiraceae bacterium]|nr:MobA/MobL family protein [Oscillospiraceae bacterium]MBR4655346.1 MobA/MobL family protein [Oscillospiraceae bacterium]
MAIYHLEAKVVSRGAGRSACAASAYLSCSRIYNNYDGVQHDYTRKRELVAQQVFLPPNAPREWSDRETLWNAVEAAEKTKDSRLAREFVVALPVELDKVKWFRLLSGFIQTQFVSQGMCADMAIHDTDGHNPHAHILLTVRPLNPDGTWQAKTEKEYLCVKDGIEKGFTAAEIKTAQAEGWEKQYQYKLDRSGKKKAYFPPSVAEAQGLERASKYPKSTKFGRQNPISERWNSEEQLCLWREAWAKYVNRFLEQAGLEERIDHRSFADQGRDEQPTIHEGVAARAMEKKGFVSDRCELNRQIKRDNALLKSLKTAITKLTDSLKRSIPAVADLLESIRARLLVLRYSATHARVHKERAEEYLKKARPVFANYSELISAMQAKAKERKALLSERNALPSLAVFKRRELTEKLQGLTEEIEELKNEETAILRTFHKEEAVQKMAAQPNQRKVITKQARKEISDTIAGADAAARRHAEREAGFEAEYQTERSRFEEIRTEAADLDLAALAAARLAIRPEKEQAALDEIHRAYPDKISVFALRDTVSAVDSDLFEESLKQILIETNRSRYKQLREER